MMGKRVVVKIGGDLLSETDDWMRLRLAVDAWTGAGGSALIILGAGRPIDHASAAAGVSTRLSSGRRSRRDRARHIALGAVATTVLEPAAGSLAPSYPTLVSLPTGSLANLARRDRAGYTYPKVSEIQTLSRLITDYKCLATSCLYCDSAGRWWNINADTIASITSVALRADVLHLCLGDPSLLGPGAPSTGAVLLPQVDHLRRLGADASVPSSLSLKARRLCDAVDGGVGRVAVSTFDAMIDWLRESA